MRRVTSVAAMQRLAGRWRGQERRIALVPTMGYLHAGHLSLVQRARGAVGSRGRVVVSIYVNPTQFGANEDLAKYPRDLRRDTQLCRMAGVDVIFAPADAQMYPAGEAGGFSTWVTEERLSRVLEGCSRPGHFRGVATVVTKLLNMVQPAVAVFGAKDYQQVAVVRRLVRDLNFPVKVVVSPTLREADGLAMSSRNKFLTGDLRVQAAALWQAIQEARRLVRRGQGAWPAARLRSTLRRGIERQPEARVDYLEFVHPETLEPVARVERGTHLVLAVRVGRTRLIDNARL